MSREQRFALSALVAIVAITGAWWALALWPAPVDAGWLARTRAVCFGSAGNGLPDARGWALLVGQPLGMMLVLLVGWGRATRQALVRVARSSAGRGLLAGALALVALAVVAAGARVADAAGAAEVGLATPARPARSQPRLDRPAPTRLALTDQTGAPFDLERYRGRPVLVTFAFAHCETICPVLVRETLRAQALTEGPDGEAGRPAVVVVTVDPWRDTPARLPTIARQWRLPPDARVLSGPVPTVSAALEAWGVATRRDSRTGAITHPALIYVLDRRGRIAFATTGGGAYLAELVSRL